MWKDFWYFSREERKGIIVLVVLIVICIAITCVLSVYKTDSLVSKGEFEKEYADFIASLKERNTSFPQKKKDYPSEYPKEEREIIMEPFDPNSADSLTFLRLGLRPWMAKNILHYRAKGGKFQTPEEFKKVYGLTNEQYESLLPYIYIKEEFRRKEPVSQFAEAKPTDAITIFKYPEGTVLDLNLADTTELKKIPGIGSGIANRIAAYRKRLGGFYSVEQLQEIQLVGTGLNKWFCIQTNGIVPINVNKASVDRLRSHPYINFYQAKAIVEYRKKKGNLKSLSQLQLYEEFTPEDLERIGHYVSFE